MCHLVWLSCPDANHIRPWSLLHEREPACAEHADAGQQPKAFGQILGGLSSRVSTQANKGLGQLQTHFKNMVSICQLPARHPLPGYQEPAASWGEHRSGLLYLGQLWDWSGTVLLHCHVQQGCLTLPCKLAHKVRPFLVFNTAVGSCLQTQYQIDLQAKSLLPDCLQSACCMPIVMLAAAQLVLHLQSGPLMFRSMLVP